MMIILPFLVLLFSSSSSSSFLVLAQNLKLDCDPCIERANYNIKAITHGLSDELFWQKNKASMIEASKDMGVNFVMDLYDTFDSETMAADIRAAADGSVDALIVTIPTKEVQDAVADVKDTVSVFGFNQDLDDDFTRSLLGFVGSDEAEAGQVAGKQIVSLLEEDDVDKASGFLLNHAPELEGLEARIQNIQDATKDVVDWTVFKSDDIVRDLQNLTAALANCTYDVIQTLGTSPMKVTLSALDANDCMEDKKILGTFDVSTEIYDMLSTGMLDFSVSQQTYLQSSLPVVMASLYASTGLVLNVPTKFGKYLSGPKLVTADTLPSANIQACSEVAFPVCSSDDALLASQDDTGACACTNRPDIKLSVITHAQKGSAFWDTIYSAFDTAAMDMNVSLGASRFDAELTSAEVIEKQITAIEEACRSEIDGLIVSFPDASTVDAVKGCTEKGIPVVVINAGPDLAVDGGYHYIGQNDYKGGLEAGKRLIDAGAESGWCVSHANVSSVFDRCDGFEEAFTTADNAEYMGVINIPNVNNATEYKVIVESTIGESIGEGTWDGVGALAAGEPQIVPMLSIVQDHSELLAGAFDVNSALFQALDDGELLFGINQDAYEQGYYPVVMLTWMVSTDEEIVNDTIETGPNFVLTAPSKAARTCSNNDYVTCEGSGDNETEETKPSEDDTGDSSSDSDGSTDSNDDTSGSDGSTESSDGTSGSGLSFDRNILVVMLLTSLGTFQTLVSW